ncbi:MAG: hypothetical protein H0X36_01495 [Sphingomonadaceae bacterium]|nr:hypothetical protein [Sphingomonadaceae bacterium]
MESEFIGKYFDTDIVLRDASVDPHNRPTRRMIANAAIGVEVDDAYYSLRELREAVAWVHEGDPRGKPKLKRMLANECDDYQRCLYYALAGRGIVQMLDDLEWLEEILEARARIVGVVRRTTGRSMPLVAPYVSAEPDGILPAPEGDFRQGPSWYLDPSLTH